MYNKTINYQGEENGTINLSVVIPVFNTEQYLHTCVGSLLQQHNIRLEIILIDDGSTDRSGEIAEQYASRDKRIKVIHQENGGASAARNTGLSLAQGEYIAFFDSDDWVKEDTLCELYHKATMHQADVLMGRIWFCRQDGSLNYQSKRVHDEVLNIPLSGKICFSMLIESNAYLPMTFAYIYRKQYLDIIQARFEEGIVREDELWTPPVLCQAEKMVIVDLEFYYYRFQDNSVSNSTGLFRHLYSLQRVTNKLFEFADRFTFSGDDRVLKNWMYTNIFKIMSYAHTTHIPMIKDSSIVLPEFQLDRLHKDSHELMPVPLQRCNYFFHRSEAGLNYYNDWLASCWVEPVASQLKLGKKLMLIYNTIWGKPFSLKIENVPADWVITTDRLYLQQADVVVFHLPGLFHEMEFDIEKKQWQIWVAWYLGSEKNYPWILCPEIADNFDLRMNYHRGADVIHPCYLIENTDIFYKHTDYFNKQNKSCIFNSEEINEEISNQYLQELIIHTETIELNRFFSNSPSYLDRIKESGIEVFANYKFVISFEDAIEEDYVTEKFYEPLVAGSIPIYLGAPNIHDFAPGDNCFVDVRQFDSPRSLAQFINSCYEDEQLYAKFFEWKKQPLRQSFLQKAEIKKEHPFVRLCRKVDEKSSLLK